MTSHSDDPADEAPERAGAPAGRADAGAPEAGDREGGAPAAAGTKVGEPAVGQAEVGPPEVGEPSAAGTEAAGARAGDGRARTAETRRADARAAQTRAAKARVARARAAETGGPGAAGLKAGAAGRRESSRDPGEAWNIFGTLIAGMAFWGLVGFGLDRLLGFSALFLPIGLALGIAASMYLVIYRLGRRP